MADDAAPTAASDAAPAILRADHLGASTFIENGWNRLSACDYDAAEAELLRALSLSPGNAEATVLLGWAKMRNAKYDDALALFRQLLMREPEHALARANMSYVFLRMGRLDEAVEQLSGVIRTGGDRRAELYAHLYLGLAERERERYAEAETVLLRALELGPNLVEAWLELGRTYWLAGRPGDARTAWQKGVAANRFSPWGKRCAEVLATVEAGGAPSRD